MIGAWIGTNLVTLTQVDRKNEMTDDGIGRAFLFFLLKKEDVR